LAHFFCKCDERMWNGLTPNDIQYWVYSDRKMDKICENDTIDVIALWDIYDYDVWRCPKCKRLYVFQDGSNTPKYIYQLEDG